LETWSIKQAAKKTGLSEDTIRYYEKIHLLPRAKRNNSGHRVYGSDDIDRMIFITCLKSAGMSLETIKYYLDLDPDDPNTATERLALLKEQKEKVEAKIADLQKTLQYIEYKVDLYQGRVSESKAQSLPNRK
jgi:MerR family copper efflux transcriptional regulator